MAYGSTANVIVLRAMLDEAAARALVEEKKHSAFGILLSRPKNEDVNLQSIDLAYECLRTVSGKYEAEYLRNATHTLAVEKSVRRVIIGDKSFEILPQSRIKKALAVRRGTAKIEIDLKEHVSVDNSAEITFDADGNEIKDPKYKISTETTEARPDIILGDSSMAKMPSMGREDAVAVLEERLKSSLESDIEDLKEQFDLVSITELYVPIFEARIRGPDNRVAIMRVDAARKKII